MGFWILAVLAAVSIVIALGYALFAPAHRAAKASAEFDMEVYRDQLKELDRDTQRGVIDPTEAERAKIEISRRLLEADRAAKTASGLSSAPTWVNVTMLALMGALIVGGGAWLYSDLGAPGYADMPLEERKAIANEARENRPDQETVEAQIPVWSGPDEGVPEDYVALVVQLREAVAGRPDDPQGLALLAQHEAQLGNFAAAWRAQAHLIEIEGESETSDATYAELAEMMILAANGYVSPEAETALTRSLKINPQNEIARYYTGLMFAQTGRPDLAFRLWRALYESSDPSAPWIGPIAAQIGELAAAAGVDYTPAPRAPMAGPSAADVEAAGDMTDEERQDMIRGMVDRLMARLAEEGGSAEEWARLISSLGILGDTERAGAIWGEAQSRFAVAPEELAIIREAAVAAGVEPAGALPGPSAEDIDNAADMNAEDRGAMINDMVNRLSDRISNEGGTAEEWARLISSLGVLGEDKRAAQFWEEAQKAFWDDPAGLETVRAAAQQAGVAE